MDVLTASSDLCFSFRVLEPLELDSSVARLSSSKVLTLSFEGLQIL
jgi:hypothetical protein